MIKQSNSSQRRSLRRLEFGDALIFFYVLAFVRQYFWLVHNNRVAWFLTFGVSTLFWYFYLSTRPFSSRKYGISFWLVVGLPLLIAYVMRAAFPDLSYDVLSYHILNSERSLYGALYAPGDYFPTALPFNPIPDALTGMSRFILGYRLGTIINLLALVWAAQIVDRLLDPFIRNPWFRSAAVLLVVLIENALFEISTYMVDLLTLPLLLQATLLTLNLEKSEKRRATFIHAAVLVGASVAFKLTNLAAGLPLLAILTYKLFTGTERLRAKQLGTTILFMLAGFLAPLAPFTIYIFRLTGNPIFPIANTFFRSAYWPTHGGWDDRWGPKGFWETILWPVLIWFKPERHSELGLYSGRLSVGFLVAIAGLLLLWRNTQVRTLCILLIASSLLWSVGSMGYGRDGLFQDVLAGVTVCVIASAVTLKTSWRQASWRTAVAVALFAVLTIQAYVACSYSLRKEWGGRTTLIADPDIYVQEAKLMLKDHSLANFLTSEERASFDKVQLWFETGPKSTAFEVLLNRHAPLLALRQAEFFHTREAWQHFIQKVEATNRQGMYSLCLPADLPNAKHAITERGLELGEVTAVSLPLFSLRDRIGMMLVEIRFPQDPLAVEKFETAWMKGAFAASDYREQIVALNPPSVMHAGEKLEIHFKVKNLGSETWPAVGTKDFRYQINMGNRWIGNGLNTEDNRAVMKEDLAPGAETDMKMVINAPRTPGDYTLEFDMVHEGVTWFKERGARPLAIQVTVEP